MGSTPLSLGFYEIDLNTMEQINLFSGFKRALKKEETVIKADANAEKFQVAYDCRACELTYNYSRDN